MILKPLTEHHLEFLSLKGGCTGLSESTHVIMSTCEIVGYHVSWLINVLPLFYSFWRMVVLALMRRKKTTMARNINVPVCSVSNKKYIYLPYSTQEAHCALWLATGIKYSTCLLAKC